MAPDLLFVLAQANLAGSAGALTVIALRRPARRLFGARAAYHLWALVPLAAAASFLPPRPTALIPAPAAVIAPANLVATAGEDLSDFFSTAPVTLTHAATGISPVLAVCTLWALGLVLMVAWLARRQLQFMGDLARGDAGPAVVGFLKPRIVTPSDFEERFNAREQTVVLAHEKIHLARHDARINALVALARCVCWFNPLVHLAAYLMRIDQELACDAAVVERHPKARAPYAQALLKAQLAARPLPLGCYWPAGTEHPLTERIAMLKKSNPSLGRRLAGGTLVGVLGLAVGYAAWAAAPAAAPIAEAPVNYVVEALTPDPAPTPAPISTPVAPDAAATPDPDPTLAPSPEPQQQTPPVSASVVAAPGDLIATNNPVTINGAITSVEWINPMAYIHVTDSSTGMAWMVGTDSPNVLLQSGGSRQNLAPGTPITVSGFQRTTGCTVAPCTAYASPVGMTSQGKALFPDAPRVLEQERQVQECLAPFRAANPAPPPPPPPTTPPTPQTTTLPDGRKVTFMGSPPPEIAAYRNALNAATTECRTKVQTAQGAVVSRSIISNAVKREGQ